jgi:hypothetical protein
MWCGKSVALPAHREYLRPFVVNGVVHFHSPTRGLRRKPAPEQPAPETRPLTWCEVEERAARFWAERRAQKMLEDAA